MRRVSSGDLIGGVGGPIRKDKHLQQFAGIIEPENRVQFFGQELFAVVDGDEHGDTLRLIAFRRQPPLPTGEPLQQHRVAGNHVHNGSSRQQESG